MDERHLVIYVAQDLDDLDALVEIAGERSLPYEFIPVRSLTDLCDLVEKIDPTLVISEDYVQEDSLYDLGEIFFHLPVIVLSNQESDDSLLNALRAGAKDFFYRYKDDSFIEDLIIAAEEAIRDHVNDQNLRSYHKELERIISSQTDSIKQSNEKLSSEILKRSQAVSELNDSRDIYRNFFQTSQDAVYISSKDGRWIDMNNAALELFGYDDRQDIWNDSVLDYYWNPSERQAFTQAIQEKGLVNDYPIKLRKRDGSSFDALISASPYNVRGELIGYQGFIRDISDRLEAEEEKNRILETQRVLDSLSTMMGNNFDLVEIGKGITSHLNQLFPSDIFNLLRVDHQSRKFQSVYRHSNLSNSALKPYLPVMAENFPLEQQEKLIEEAAPRMLADIRSQLDEGSEQLSNLVVFLVPIVADHKVVGMMQIVNLTPDQIQDEDLELVNRAASVVAIGLQKTFLYEESQANVNKLTSLQRIEQTILENLSLPTTLDLMLDMLVRELAVDAADVLYFHDDRKALQQYSRSGFRQKILNFNDLEIGVGLGGKVAETRTTLYVTDLGASEHEVNRKLEFETEKFVSYVGVPLLTKGRLVGVLEIFQRDILKPTDDWFSLLEMVAGLAAIAIDFQNLYQNLAKSKAEISTAFDKLIVGWAEALELRGIESKGHSSRVAELTLDLAKRLGLKEEDMQDLRRGALLHDIGKMGIADEILLKKSDLSKEDRKKIGKHPVDAYNLLAPVKALENALDIPLYHHERWDGAGYPEGISGEEIPLYARIYAVIDVWDAMLTSRPYRKAFSKQEAIKHIEEQSGKHFDPTIAKAFLEMVDSWVVEEEEPEPTEQLEGAVAGDV